MTPNFDSSMGWKSWSSCCWRDFASSYEKMLSSHLLPLDLLSRRLRVFSDDVNGRKRVFWTQTKFVYLYFLRLVIVWSVDYVQIIWSWESEEKMCARSHRMRFKWNEICLSFVSARFWSSFSFNYDNKGRSNKRVGSSLAKKTFIFLRVYDY